jgi:hypothetical protein
MDVLAHIGYNYSKTEITGIWGIGDCDGAQLIIAQTVTVL